jgi:hypothetical protein
LKVKGFYLTLIVLTVITFIGCGKADQQIVNEIDSATADETTTQEITEQGTELEKEVEVVYQDVTYTLAGCEYVISSDWMEEVVSEYQKNYKKSDAAIMTTYMEVGASITDEKIRSTYMESFVSSMDNCEITNEFEAIVAGKNAYGYDLIFTVGEIENKATLVSFDCNNGIITFMLMSINETENMYQPIFENILSTVSIIEVNVEEN